MSARRRTVVAVALGCAATAAVLAMTRSGPGVTVDSGEYLAVAEGVVDGHGYSMPYLSYSERYPDEVRLGQRVAMTQYPPGFPTVLAAGTYATGSRPIDVARWVNAVTLGVTTALVTVLVSGATGSLAWAALAGALLVRPPMVFAHARVLSEPLALLALVATVMLLRRQLARPSRTALAALTGVCAVGGLVRFPSVVVTVTAAFALLCWRATSWRRRAGEAALVLAGGVLPLLLWFLRNALVAGGASEKGIAWHWPSGAVWRSGSDKWLAWLGPHDGPRQAVTIAIVVALAGWTSTRFIARARRRPRGRPGLAGLCALSAAAHASFVVAARTLLDANLSFGSRMMLPVLLLATVGVCASATSLGRRGQVAVAGVALAVLAWSTSALVGTNIPRFPGNESSGYLADRWTRSPAIEMVDRLDPAVAVVTNAPDAIWLHTGRASLFVPLPVDLYRGRANSRFPEQVESLRRAVRERDVVVVFFRYPTRQGRVRSLDRAVVSSLGLVVLRDTGDATVYVRSGQDAGRPTR